MTVVREDDVRWLSGLVGRAAPPEGWAEDEHLRYRLYQECLAACPSAADEERIVEIVVRDQDAAMAESTLVWHVDRLAPDFTTAEDFADRVSTLAGQAPGFAFLQARIGQWVPVKRAEADPEGSVAAVLAGNLWLQRTIADTSRSPVLLGVLAERGAARKLRNTAADRLRRLASAGGAASP
ncbi:hypothetical protein [Kitasatospora arboriphila]|uniref:HEAT repeat domain-containing protein n=1 Tax=Kitasatospora arboriphila TaxID=258052 RepID=A0ABN1TGE1_9ACTN